MSAPRTLVAMLLGLSAAIPTAAAGTLGAEWLPFTMVSAFGLALLSPVSASWAGASTNTTDRAAFAGSVASLAFVPGLALLALIRLGNPLVTAHLRCGTGDVALIMLVPVLALVSCSLLVPIALLGTRAKPRADRWIARLAHAVVILAVPTTVIAAAHAGRPTPEAYLASLPRLELSSGQKLVLPDGYGQVGLDSSTAPGTRTCRLVFSDPPGKEVDLDYVFGLGAREAGCPHLRLAPGADWVLVESQDSRGAWGFRAAVVRSPNWHLSDLSLRDLHGRAGAPRGWTTGAAFGWLLAFAILLAARRASSSTRRVMLHGVALSVTALTQAPLAVEAMLRVL